MSAARRVTAFRGGLVALLLALGVVMPPSASAAEPSSVGTFAMNPPSSLGPIVRGADGALWFTELSRNQIGRVTTAGQLSQFPIPTPASNPMGIVSGPDGRIWFTETDKAAIGAVSTSGMITEYSLPSGTSPFAIAAGADGRLWFTALAFDQDGNLAPEIGAITTGGAVSTYPVGGVPAGITVAVQSITNGSDGRLWFTEEDQDTEQCDKIGAITTGGVISQYALPEYKSLPVGPAAIISAPDGRLWFTTDNGGTGLGAITTNGDISYFTGPEVSGQPVTLGGSAITFGADGRLWMAQSQQVAWTTADLRHYGSISVPGSVRPPCGDCGSVALHGLAAGPDGRMWLTYTTSNAGGTVMKAGILAVPTAAVVSAAQCVVPNVVGLSLRAARARLAHNHCRLGRVTHRRAPGKPGHVLSQSPKPRRKLPNDSAVSVTERTSV